MKKFLFLLIVAALISSCESKSGKLRKNPTSSIVLVNADAEPTAPKTITLEQMEGYEAVGVVRLCGPSNEAWSTVVLKLYGVNDSAIYVWNSPEAKYLFLNFKK